MTRSNKFKRKSTSRPPTPTEGKITGKSTPPSSVSPSHSAQLSPSGSKEKAQAPVMPSVGTGCLTCGADDDHASLMLCEACNAEYHTYCVDPPLKSVPEGDFFCDKCKLLHQPENDDGLEDLVSALSPEFTSRFGEIVWAAGGVGFGWWPACVYDPRLTVGGARHLAKRNLGKKHLVYFFECNEAPFTVLLNSKIASWEEGIIEEYDLGKTARATKNKTVLFERALQTAISEYDKPIEMRLEWNHQNSNGPPSPTLTRSVKKKQKRGEDDAPSSAESKKPSTDGSSTKGRRGRLSKDKTEATELAAALAESEEICNSKARQVPAPSPTSHGVKRNNLNAALSALSGQNNVTPIESHEDGALFCKILQRPHTQSMLESGAEDMTTCDAINIGFVTLPSRRKSTFKDVRCVMDSDLDEDAIVPGTKWKFYIPNLGPMSLKQEAKMGPMLDFLNSTTCDSQLGDGTHANPLTLMITKIA
eukprot:scaffold20070_cov58-Attheya_sp.AAC.5